MSAADTIPPLEKLRGAAAQIAAQMDLRLVVLFGSAARAHNSAPRDLDLAVLADRTIDAVELTNRLIHALGVQQVDVADLNRADPLLMMSVARDGLPLYERRRGEFDRFVSLAVRRYADTRKFRAMEAQEIRDFIAAGRTAS